MEGVDFNYLAVGEVNCLQGIAELGGNGRAIYLEAGFLSASV